MMALAIVATDNGDGTTTFNASGMLTDATVQVARWNGRSGPQQWHNVGVISPPSGSITVPLPHGAYLVIATAGSQVSDPYYLPCFDQRLAVNAQCENAIAETIRRLSLPEIGDRVYVQLVPHDLTAVYPCVFVTSNEGIETNDSGGANATADIGYPIRVIAATRAHENQNEIRVLLAGWRQSIRRTFDGQRLPDVPAVKRTTVEYGPRLQYYMHPAAGQSAYQVLATVLTIRCLTREPRGFGQ